MELEILGFREAGAWASSETWKSGITFELKAFADDRVIYAFVVDGSPMYIGICERDTTTLRDRMQRYRSLAGAGTNERIAGKILRCLAQGKTVHIWALRPNCGSAHQALPIDLVKGLENPLIASLNPAWNVAGAKRSSLAQA